MNFVARHIRLLRVLCLVIALAALFVAPRASVACPTCKDAVAANDPEHEHMVKGYFYSILFMMGMPYLLLSSFGLYMYLEVRKARARDAAKAGEPPRPDRPLAPASAAAVPEPESQPENQSPAESRELVEV